MGSVAATRLQLRLSLGRASAATSSRMPFRGPSETSAQAPTVFSGHEDVLSSFDLHLLDEYLPRPQAGPPPSPTGAQRPQAVLGDCRFPSDGCHWLPSPPFGCPSEDSPAAAQYPSPAVGWSPRGADDHPLASLAIGSVACEDALPGGAPPGGAPPGGAQQILLPRWTQCRVEGKQPAYEWPPQSDPELERKRRRAVRAFRNRQRASQRELAMQEQMMYMASVISRLQAEKAALEQKIALLQSQLESLQPANVSR